MADCNWQNYDISGGNKRELSEWLLVGWLVIIEFIGWPAVFIFVTSRLMSSLADVWLLAVWFLIELLGNVSAVGRAIAQAVSRLLATTAARVRAYVRSYGIWGGQNGTAAGVLWVLGLPMPVLIPFSAPHSSCIIRGWYKRPLSGWRTKWDSGFPPRRPGFKPGSGHVGFCDGKKWRWGRFSPRTSVSPTNLHSICISRIIFTITRGWHNRPGVAAVPITSQTK
jgi:hypothetical protein